MVAIGVGCRKGCPATAIVDLVEQARAAAPAGLVADRHGGRRGVLPRDALRAVMASVETRSAAAEARFGVASVAEAAALAGAGPGARLVVRRIAAGGATCAVAAGDARP